MSERPTNRRRLVHGRRVGHRLRARQQRLVDELLPCLRIDIGDGGAVEPRSLFGPEARCVWLEIGFGGGEHLAWQAAANPDVGIIGCEPFVNGVAKLLTEIEDRNLANVRIHDGDARDLLDLLAPASLDRVFLLYPDPWPKARHRKRRLITARAVERLARVMTDGAELRIASDIPDYVRWTLVHILSDGRFDWTARRPADWRHRPSDWPPTRYERKALDSDRVPAYLTFIRARRGG
jgi:tRNA (guanine-N7-)-methyltransferase